MNQIKTVLVTGAGGFLGSHLLTPLLESGYQVQALSSQKAAIEKQYGNRVKAYDFADFDAGELAWGNVDCVNHCAFATQSERKHLAESLAFTQSVFLKAAKAGVSRVINFSTRSVYGADASLQTDEKSAVNPINEYGLAKYASELLLESIAKQSNMHYVNLRLSSLLGAGYDVRLVNKFVKAAMETGEIKIVGGKQSFSFMDVRDATSAILALIESDAEGWNTTYNLGSNTRYSILELAQLVADVVKRSQGMDVKITVDEKEIMLTAGMDSSLFYQTFRWQPRYSIEETVQNIVSYVNV